MIFEWKLPRIEVKPMVYGEYLTLHSNMIPEPKISLDTEGYLVEEVDYGTASENVLPFNKDDWVEKKYVESNFRQIS